MLRPEFIIHFKELVFMRDGCSFVINVAMQFFEMLFLSLMLRFAMQSFDTLTNYGMRFYD